MIKEIAALFVDSGGPYFNYNFIDCYDINRDAISYKGDLPVICHPPCNLWGKFAKINYLRWGGDHNKPGNDGGKFKFALEQVNRCGGVLEHPAGSYAWEFHGLKKPMFGIWEESGQGWVTEVWQSAYGHKANKKTWLYCKSSEKPKDLIWRKIKGTHQIGYYDQRGKLKNKPTVTKKEAIHTPEKFIIELIELTKPRK